LVNLVAFWHSDERFTGPHNDRLKQVHPSTLAHGRRRQQAEAVAGAWVNLEDGHMPTNLDAFQVETWNNSVVRKTKREMRVVKKGRHRGSLLRHPHSDIVIFINLNVNDIRATARRAILDVFL
jgi:hypothetical protein